MSWETFHVVESERGGDAWSDEMQIQRGRRGLQLRLASRPADDEDAAPVVQWTSDEDLDATDLLEALEELAAEHDLTEETVSEAAENLEPFLNAGEWRTIMAKLRG